VKRRNGKVGQVMRKRRAWRQAGGESGQVIAIVAVVLPVLLGFVALALEFGALHLYLARAQAAADAAALAGASTGYVVAEQDAFGTVYSTQVVVDAALAREKGLEAASRNLAGLPPWVEPVGAEVTVEGAKVAASVRLRVSGMIWTVLWGERIEFSQQATAEVQPPP